MDSRTLQHKALKSNDFVGEDQEQSDSNTVGVSVKPALWDGVEYITRRERIPKCVLS